MSDACLATELIMRLKKPGHEIELTDVDHSLLGNVLNANASDFSAWVMGQLALRLTGKYNPS